MTKLQLIPLSLLLLMITLAISAAGDSLGGDTITIPGDSRSIIFNPGDYMGDLNGQHLILEPNCNLVLYNGTTPLWASSSARPTNPSKCQAAFQMDGHLVVYADDTAIWASGTYTSGLVEGRLQLQGGHFQIVHTYVDDYEITFDVSNPAPHGGAHWRPISDTGSVVVNADDDDDLLMQENEFLGDLTGTYLILQDDCNLLLYNQERAIWASNSYKPVLLACEVALRRDGNLEVHAKDRPEVVFWSSASITNNDAVVSTELRVSDDMFELIQTLDDESEVTYDNGDL